MLISATIDLTCLLIVAFLAPVMGRQLAETYQLQERALVRPWLALSAGAACAVIWFDLQRLDIIDQQEITAFMFRHLVQAYIAALALMCLAGNKKVTPLNVLTLQGLQAGVVLMRYMLELTWDINFEIDAYALAICLIWQGIVPVLILRSTPRAVRQPLAERTNVYGFGRRSGARKMATLRGQRAKFSGPVKKQSNQPASGTSDSSGKEEPSDSGS